MTTLRLSLIFVLALTSWAQAAPAPHVVARSTQSYGALGGTTLTLWSDGYAELMKTQDPGEHRSGRIPPKKLAELLASLQATGLTEESYTQRSKHPIIKHGFESLELLKGTELYRLEEPALGKANAATQALSARVAKATQQLQDAIRPHLKTQGPAGRYAQVHVLGKANDASRRETPAELSPALERALARPGSYVLLPPAERDQIKHGARGVVNGREVVWILQELKAPASETPDKD